MTRFSLPATLAGAARALAAHPVLFVGLAVVSQLPALAASVLILPRIEPGPENLRNLSIFYIFAGFGHMVVAGWATALMAAGAVRHSRGEQVTLGGCFRTWWQRPLSSLGIAILTEVPWTT